MSLAKKPPRRPSLDKGLGFYSGKRPEGAGVTRKKLTAKAILAPTENKLPSPSTQPSPKSALPDYCQPAAPPKPKPAPPPPKPTTTARFDKNGKMTKRPSLSEQLANIGASVGNITNDIKKVRRVRAKRA
jgi:hypothetical protein